MKRYSALVLILSLTVLMFSYCKSSKKAQAAKAPEPPKVAYKDGLHTVIMANCSPCHIPEKGGNKKAYNNYENAKADIDEILRRIQLIRQTKDLCLLGKISSTTAPLLFSSYGKSKVCLSNLASKEIPEFRFAGAWFVG